MGIMLMAMFLITGSLFAPPLLGADERPGSSWPENHPVLQAGKEVEGEYFAFGSHVAISGTVHGDVYAAGRDVLVDGVIDGDLIAVGETIVLSGTVSQNVRIAAGEVTASGRIGRNATVAGGDIHVSPSSQVKGNWLAAGRHLQLAGPIGGDVRIAAGDVTVSDSVGGDLSVAASSIRLASNASIGRHFRYWSQADPSIEEGVRIRGTVIRRPIPDVWHGEWFLEKLTALKLAWTAISFFSTLLIGLIVVHIYLIFCLAVDWTIRERPLASLGMGAAALIGLPIVILVSCATVLALPLGLVLAALYVAVLYLARIFVMVWAGQLLLLPVSESPSPTWAFAVGLLYSLCMLVPVVGPFVTVTTLFVGVGALLLTKKALIEQLRERRLV
jgi:cytoskeletal protein CcmA (bactofilin family)